MKVELLEVWGSDKHIVNAARVSYGKEVTDFTEKDANLLKYLKEHNHTSPFRHSYLQYRIQCPIFVERQCFKHQIGMSANSISGRYVDFSDSYHEVTELRMQSASSKQGSEGTLDRQDLIDKMNASVADNSDLYAELCEAGVAKEQARVILPLSLETQFIWSGSFQAFVHLWGLRLKPDAQQETREVAQEMLDLVKNHPDKPFEHSLKAWGYGET